MSFLHSPPITFKKYNPNATYNVDLFYADYSIDLHVKKYEYKTIFYIDIK